MLAAAARLRASDDFRRTVRSGVRAARPTLVVHARTPHSPPGTRLTSTDVTQVGFVVSKSVGGAVVRNRVKRRLRHLSRPLAASAPGLHVVVRALPAAAAASSETLSADLTGAWQASVRRLTARP